jgi:uncharacterized protein YegJ (DUF2314 family)
MGVVMFWRRKRSKFPQPQKEPLFIAIRNDDSEMLRAYAQAAATTSVFRAHVLRTGDHYCCAKLRFRDLDQSERLGEDRFVYLWLSSVVYHPEQQRFSGVFFELPEKLTKWHQLGERLNFEATEIFDWMVNDNGRLHGGFTLRVARAHLPQSDREAYDQYTGVKSWEPLPPSAA